MTNLIVVDRLLPATAAMIPSATRDLILQSLIEYDAHTLGGLVAYGDDLGTCSSSHERIADEIAGHMFY